MENNIKFRNHVSVILENSIKGIGTAFSISIFILNFVSGTEETGKTNSDVVLLVVELAVILAIVLGWQAIVWAKTYISVQDNTLIIERNTLNKKRNTIGLNNISNVNLEQNVLEMILGTCKVKLDTNSLSTADKTDVNIVLKKRDAEDFRQIILGKAQIKESEEEEAPQKAEITQRKHVADMADIIIHGLFSIRILSVILLIGIVILQTKILADMGGESLGDNIVEIVLNLFTAFWLALAALWSIVKEFIKYIGFNIERKQDKVFLSYGLLKKVAYSVPVDKINAIRFTQTPLARIGKHYMVEIINVGMDDDENETNTFFLPYAKKEKLLKLLHLLLPEFEGCIDIKEEKQPKCIWLIWIPKVLMYLLFAGVGYAIVSECVPELKETVIFVAGVIALWRLIVKVAGFRTKGLAVHSKFLKIVDGAFGKRMLFVKYDKIQYVTGKQSIIAKNFKVQKATIALLASMKNRIHELPYFKENDMEVLKNQLI